MNLSLYLGRFFGLYLLIAGLLLIVRGHSLRVIIHDFYKSPPLIVIGGALAVILGLLLVLAHNVWDWSWRVIVTLLAYSTLIRGILHLYLPEWSHRFYQNYFDNAQTLRIIGAILASLGVFLILCTLM